MRAYLRLSAGLFALLPAVAYAECQPNFVDGSNTVLLTPSATMEDQQLIERFYIRVRNDGDDACTLRLAVGRDIQASDNSFPNYTLVGPNGNIPIVALPAASSNPNVAATISVPANGQVAIPYDVRLAVGWGSESGSYIQELVYLLLPVGGRDEIANQRTQLRLNIPATVQIRFAGALGEAGPPRIEMGVLSPTARTYSPPFAIRVLSTSAYQMQLVSQNGGALVRTGGTELIPYRLSVDANQINLAGGGAVINASSHTGPGGDVHPVSVAIDPDPSRHAGDYSDRVTVTVTAN